MKKNFLPFIAVMFFCALFLTFASAVFLFPTLRLSAVPVFRLFSKPPF